MVRNHQGNKQPIEPSLVNQTTSKADYTTVISILWDSRIVSDFPYFRVWLVARSELVNFKITEKISISLHKDGTLYKEIYHFCKM